jgi:hypothetical protein
VEALQMGIFVEFGAMCLFMHTEKLLHAALHSCNQAQDWAGPLECLPGGAQVQHTPLGKEAPHSCAAYRWGLRNRVRAAKTHAWSRCAEYQMCAAAGHCFTWGGRIASWSSGGQP